MRPGSRPAGELHDQQRDSWKALGIRSDIPHPARVYDYLLDEPAS